MTDGTEDWYSTQVATFGDRVTGAREAAGMTQEQLARRLGIAAKSLQAWEDDRSDPRANRLATLAGMLGVSIPWLLTGSGTGPAAPTDSGPEITPDDMRAVLGELRDIRAGMLTQVRRTERLENRLRQSMGAGEPG